MQVNKNLKNIIFFKTKHFAFLAATLTAVIIFSTFAQNKVLADSNLLTNPGFETGDLTGWNLIQNGGNGWSNTWGAHTGNYGFDTSYGMDSTSQTVDLIASGYTQNNLDNQQPAINFSVWLNDRCDSGAQYYITYELIGDDGNTVIASSDNNFGNSNSTLEVPSPCGTWKQESYTFTNYGAGVKYAYIEFGGYSDNYWAGNYGAQFDDASINLSSTPNLPTSLEPNDVVNGQISSNNQPVFNASLSDPGVGTQVQYEIQISKTANFSSPILDYTSALAAPGNISFAVGQNPGNGTYSTGSAGQVLPLSSYYWRIKTIGDDSLSSAWVVANNDNIAFSVGTNDPVQAVSDPKTPPDTGYGTPMHSVMPLVYIASMVGLLTLLSGIFILVRHTRAQDR